MPHEDIRWIAGAYLIADGVWSIFLKKQADDIFLDEVTLSRVIRIGIGIGLVASSNDGLTEREIDRTVQQR